MKKFLISAAIVLSSLASVHAQAEGFLGGLIEDVCGGCGVGRTLDEINANLGQPVDHAAAAVADAFVPGAGQAAEAYWALRRAQEAAQRGQRIVSNGMPGAAMPGGVMGNFCGTQMGRFGPGPWNPVGTPCNVMTPYGPTFGSVIQ